jgi:hypothetical protein
MPPADAVQTIEMQPEAAHAVRFGREESLRHDGPINGRNPAGMLRPDLAADEVVPEAGRRTGMTTMEEKI